MPATTLADKWRWYDGPAKGCHRRTGSRAVRVTQAGGEKMLYLQRDGGLEAVSVDEIRRRGSSAPSTATRTLANVALGS